MKLHRWNNIATEQLSDTVTRQVIHTSEMTLARLQLHTGAVVHRHQHPAEQITTVMSGRLRFIFDDGESVVAANESLEIPSGVPHSVEALEDTFAVDVFAPRRQDWIDGDDAYLRRR